MTNERQEEQLQDWQRQALLTEYTACQHEASARMSYSWQSGIIFFVTTLTLTGVVVSGLAKPETSLYRLLVIAILGGFSIASLFAWNKYADRQRFVRGIMYDRMRAIERELGLRKNMYVDFLDKATDNNWKETVWLPLKETERVNLREHYLKHPGRKPRGFKWSARIAWFVIIAWIILIIMETSIFFSPVVRQWLLDP